MSQLIDGPNALGFDNSIGPCVLYALCTKVAGPAVLGPNVSVVDEVFIGSDAAVLVKQGEAMAAEFAKNKIDAVFYFRVVQAQ